MVGRNQLMTEAIHVEQNLIKENVGSQDQQQKAYGSFNVFKFHQDGSIQTIPLIIGDIRKRELNSNLLLFSQVFPNCLHCRRCTN